tara:strand:- start:8137 stop:8382 length:246 start_codon:yes stop_codon:yes gene_type:complete
MKGSVTISLEDYEKLKDSSKNAKELESATRKAAKELQVFLSFLCTRGSIEEYVTEFNRQSKLSEISVVDGIARIKFKDDKN